VSPAASRRWNASTSNGPTGRAAGRACRDALDGWRSPRDAHKAFLNAARRAELIPAAVRASRKPRPASLIDGLRPEMSLS